MYKECFKKQLVLNKEFIVSVPLEDFLDKTEQFLINQKYRDIKIEENIITGFRGKKILNLFNLGDPRRNFHTIKIKFENDKIMASTEIDSWFALGTKEDINIFYAELEILKNFLKNDTYDDKILKKAHRKRKISDFKTFFILFVLGITLGLLIRLLIRYKI